jgi:hypothetical protein
MPRNICGVMAVNTEIRFDRSDNYFRFPAHPERRRAWIK